MSLHCSVNSTGSKPHNRLTSSCSHPCVHAYIDWQLPISLMNSTWRLIVWSLTTLFSTNTAIYQRRTPPGGEVWSWSTSAISRLIITDCDAITPVSSPSMTGHFRLLLHVPGTVCLSTPPQHPHYQSSELLCRPTFSLDRFNRFGAIPARDRSTNRQDSYHYCAMHTCIAMATAVLCWNTTKDTGICMIWILLDLYKWELINA